MSPVPNLGKTTRSPQSYLTPWILTLLWNLQNLHFCGFYVLLLSTPRALCVPLLLYRRHCGGTLPPQAPRARLLNHNNYKSNCSKSMSSSTHSSIITLLTMVLCCSYCYCYPSPKEQFFNIPPPHQKQIHFIICMSDKTLSLKSWSLWH